MASDVFHVGSVSLVLSCVGGLRGAADRFGRLVRDAIGVDSVLGPAERSGFVDHSHRCRVRYRLSRG